jgi:hypothetical protein
MALLQSLRTAVRLFSLPPNCRLGPTELVKFSRAQRRLCDREELVELRRRHRSAAQHCVCLATVMDLVLEQVQQKAIRTLRLHARASVHVNDAIGAGIVECLAPADQSAINRCLRGPKLRHGRTRYRIRPRGGAERAAFQRIDIKPIDNQDMVQRRLDRREKAGLRSFELRLRQPGAGCEQAMVRPGVVVRHGPQGLRV